MKKEDYSEWRKSLQPKYNAEETNPILWDCPANVSESQVTTPELARLSKCLYSYLLKEAGEFPIVSNGFRKWLGAFILCKRVNSWIFKQSMGD